MKKACIIGAGCAGLVAVKSMLEAGFEVTCYDDNKSIGGRWNENNKFGIARFTVTNLCKTSMAYSDFPFPEDTPLFFSADLLQQYLENYVQNFNILPHIVFGCAVTKVTPVDNANPNTQWSVTYKNRGTEESETKIFDFLLVCSGFNDSPHIPPDITNALTEFTGEVLHSAHFLSTADYKDKKVVVCGFGNTGCDIACELANINPVTYLATNRGGLVIPRILHDRKINNSAGKLRLLDYIPDFIAHPLFKRAISKIESNDKFDQKKLGVGSSVQAGIYVINDEICYKVTCGKVVMKTGIKNSVGRTIYFKDGTKIENVDTVVLSTGYERRMSFFDSDVVSVGKNGKHLPLYKQIINPRFTSLAFTAMASNPGSSTILSEIQSRYAAQVFLGKIKLPSQAEMSFEIEKAHAALVAEKGEELKEYNLITGSSWVYYEQLARQIGCNVSVWKMLFTDPQLACKLFWSKSVHEYRLQGPNKWNGARQAILNEQSSLYNYLSNGRIVQ